MINGCTVAGLGHDQVVKLIRTARDSQTGTELTLTVKQNGKFTLFIIYYIEVLINFRLSLTLLYL